MAGIAQNGSREHISSSPIGRLARRQYGALITLRLRMLANSVRSVQGAFEFSARGVALAVYALMGISLGLGLGYGAYSLTSTGHFQYLAVLFWTVFLVWQVLPIALASFQEQFDLSQVLRFPVGFASFYLLSIVFGIVDVPAILGGICCIGIWTGVTIAHNSLGARAALVIVIYAGFNILLARTVLAWVDRWLAKRRTREIVSALFLVFMLSLQLLNPALHEQNEYRGRQLHTHSSRPGAFSGLPNWVKPALAIAPWLPPGLAAGGLRGAVSPEQPPLWMTLTGLGFYILAAGAALGIRLHSEYRGERLSEAASARKLSEDDSRWLINRSGPVAAVIEKELRIIPRSMPLLFAMGAPLVTVLVISTVLRNHDPGGRPFLLAFPLCVCYALLGFTQMIFNNLGSEGTGIQFLFLSPTPIRSVLLAKNLLYGGLFCLVAVLAGVFAAFRLGGPDLPLIAATAAWVLFALPANLAAGNLLSLTMPYRVNLGRLSRQRGSQASALVSMLIQALVVGCGLGVLELAVYLRNLWLAAPALLVMALLAGLVWFRVLKSADSVANRNRDHLIATLAKTE